MTRTAQIGPADAIDGLVNEADVVGSLGHVGRFGVTSPLDGAPWAASVESLAGNSPGGARLSSPLGDYAVRVRIETREAEAA